MYEITRIIPNVNEVENKNLLQTNNLSYKQITKLMEDYYSSENYQKAFDLAIYLLKSHQDAPYPYILIGNIYQKLNNHTEAFRYFKKSCEVDPFYERINENFFKFLMKAQFSGYSKEFASGFELLLSNKKMLGHNKLSSLSNRALIYLKQNPFFSNLINDSNEFFKNKDDEAISNLDLGRVENILNQVSEFKLFHLCVEETLICNLEFEKLLIFIRKLILFKIKTLNFSKSLVKLMTTISLNNFLNEYFWEVSKNELNDISIIEKKIFESVELNIPINETDYLCLAMYKPLFKYDFKSKIPFNDLTLKLYEYTINNLVVEKNIIKNIISFCDVKDKTSIKVQNQYEHYPYPRWIYSDTYLLKTNMSGYLNSHKIKYLNIFKSLTKKKSILIAGCGTGKEAVEVRSLISDIKITAIDLSKKSLSYAIRKSQQARQKDITFMHGDILKLNNLNEKFDCIMSNGVLHHMNDPVAGLASLSSSLKKNGLIKISLYSKLARQCLLNFKQSANNIKNKNDVQAIKDFRNSLIRNEGFDNERIQLYSDFYSLSDFKDLVCNEKEHLFTIDKIKKMIRELNFKFCGFQNSGGIQDKFISYFNSSNQLFNLDYWDIFEKEFPNSFSQMYQFWLQKE